MKSKLLKIGEIKIEEDLYPRTKYDWFTANDYKHSMNAGAVFPPIDVALFRRKYCLIDGRHRIEALKLLKQEFVQANIHTGLSPKRIFQMAVQANVRHGRPLSSQDKAMIIDRLEKFKFSVRDISRLVNIPMNKITDFKFSRITNTVSGEAIYLKSTTQHFAGQEVVEDFNDRQEHFSTRGQLHLIIQVTDLIENGFVDYDDKSVINALMRLKALVSSIKLPVKVET